MLFNDILGLSHIKNHLSSSADAGRIPHAQLFVGPEGCGLLPMALAYAQYVICQNANGENNGGNEACNSSHLHIQMYILHFQYLILIE